MSMEDPFFVVKGEVQKAVNTAQGLFQRWTELLQDPSTATREEIDWTTNELRNNLRSIEWDLEDLDETINILVGAVYAIWGKRQRNKFPSGLANTKAVLANSHFIEEQQAQQQLIVEQQDEQLELVSGSIGVLKNMSQRIGGELEEQAVMLDDFSHELESTQSRLDNVMKKLAKVSHMTSDRRQWCAIAILFVVLLVVLVLFLVL
ncbi:syntaxin-6 isoform X2 [Pteronotus mesoamericanus]|uniref:syntaxin-6 isoform X2 n=1 Tax=Pteronotus mesoamericanus TaxID=1884717 RepID=UPI0023EDD7B9|nr:syntaxin-6 isoform X2 [Pteronotus parnellii mesoamericanus]